MNTSIVPSLPEEILQLIIEHLFTPSSALALSRRDSHYDEDYGLASPLPRDDFVNHQALVALCLTSKQCLRLAQPVLYRRLRPQTITDIMNLSRTILLFPHLALLVRELVADDWQWKRCFGRRDTTAKPGYEEALKARAWELAGRGGGSISHMLDQLETDHETSHLAFVMTQCHLLETLRTSAQSTFSDSYIIRYLRAAVDINLGTIDGDVALPERCCLPRLTELHASASHRNGCFFFKDLSPVLRLPSLVTFHGSDLDITEARVDYPLAVVHTSLRTVKLENSRIDVEGLRILLAYCPNLETLSIEWGHSYVRSREPRYELISETLCKGGRGLQALTFVPFPAAVRLNEDNEDTRTTLGSLKALTSLRTLRVPGYALPGIAKMCKHGDRAHPLCATTLTVILPDSLEKLSLTSGPPYDEFFCECRVGFEQAMAAMSNLRTMLIESAWEPGVRDGVAGKKQWTSRLEKGDAGEMAWHFDWKKLR